MQTRGRIVDMPPQVGVAIVARYQAGFGPVARTPLIRHGNNNYSCSRPSLTSTSFPYAALRRADGAP